ncbi:MAG: bifunctional diaminohydroxyphosphoribosylaminopyrimidine deaminase/5-amino-6-(5-phosphoribosylamino)uracil reductase RibD [Candidatus Peribacteraceae bacterium]|nr:bifunctional diaminohydroxyphosphoribosylaminopyrimidine deaminase/5-amino-6-(5-phosphoribosylamino)uracil reductase RibD [Candidatus Peribacteraceae bacterium]
MKDTVYMHRCLELAERGRGRVGVNPLVGSVLVRGGSIVAEDWHRGFGLAHAERALLESFPGSIEPDDVLYVNLEPCCHRGKTLPCTGFLIERGVRHVVYGMVDPNPHVAGKGITQLKSAGVEARGPILPELVLRLNRGFVSLHTRGRPWVTLKMACTRAGAVSNPDGSRLKITSQEQDAWAHEFLRGMHDAIMIGVGTVLSDDPQLTRRIVNKKVDQNSSQPLRIVLDPNFRIPETARLVTELAAGTIVVMSIGTSEKRQRHVMVNPSNCDNSLCFSEVPMHVPVQALAKQQRLEERGVKVFACPLRDNHFDLDALWEILTTPLGDFHGITSVLVEGGVQTWQSFREAGVLDEEVVLVGE